MLDSDNGGWASPALEDVQVTRIACGLEADTAARGEYGRPQPFGHSCNLSDMIPKAGPSPSGFPPVLRKLLLPGLAAAFLGGCASTPLASLTVEQTKFRDQELRLMFAKLIATSNGFGADNWLVGKRYYSNAQVNVPPRDDGIGIICAKATIKNDVVGVRELDLSAQLIEGPRGTSLRMSNYPDYFGSRCKTPFTPFPELELLSSK